MRVNMKNEEKKLPKLLNQELARLGLKNIPDIADKLDLDYDYLRKILKGERSIGEKLLIQIANKAGFSLKIKQLLLLAKAYDKAIKDKDTNANEVAVLWEQIQLLLTQPNAAPLIENSLSDWVEVPVWRSVKCGTGTPTEEYAEKVDTTYIQRTEKENGCFTLLVEGNGLSSDLKDGDYAIFEPLTSEDGDIIAVELPGEEFWTIKKLKIITPTRVELSGLQNEEKIIIDLNKDKMIIRGVLVSFKRSVRKRLKLG